MALINYDGDEDVEWVYDMDVDIDEDFVEPELDPIHPCYSDRRNYYSAVKGSLNFCSFQNNVNPIRFEYNKKKRKSVLQ